MPNVIDAFLEELRARRARDDAAYGTPPEPENWSYEPSTFDLRWRPETTLNEHPPPVPLNEVRAGISREILDYVESGDSRLLLVRVPPGTGKTTAAVAAAQELGQQGRVFYAGPRHDFFADITGTQEFIWPMWYEWLPFTHTLGREDGYDMCRYAPEMSAWLNRGYPSMDLCKGLCNKDGYLPNCPYRLQARRKEPIIFGMHQHLHTGMAISNYWCGFCDEMPLSAFLKRKRIPAKSILVPGAEGALKRLLEAFDYLARKAPMPLWGPKLFSMIGNDLGAVYDEQESLGEWTPMIPLVDNPSEVYQAPYWFVQDLLLSLSGEYSCWKNGWENWVSRVRVSSEGILILSREHAKDRWSKSNPLVCLDATGSPEMYRAIFDRDVRLYAPIVKRPGRIFQVVGRLNGMGGAFEGESDRLSKKGRQMLQAAELIASDYPDKRVAVITFKAARAAFEQNERFRGNARHFGDLRGTNDLESADALIVAGGFCPNTSGVMDLAASIFPDRMEPFYKQGQPPPWSHKRIEYRLRKTDPRGYPVRDVSGFWQDPHLRVVLEELRRNEITQALHRVRPNIKNSDVWLLTSLPTDEALDGVFNTLSETWLTPDRERKETKTGVPYYQGVTWEKWLLLRTWLDEQWDLAVPYLTKEHLAEIAGVSAATVTQQRWMHYIAKHTQETGYVKQWANVNRKIDPHSPRSTWVLEPVQS